MTSVAPTAFPGVIASAAKQSRIHDVSLDCLTGLILGSSPRTVTASLLAMTELKRKPSYEKRVWLRPAATLRDDPDVHRAWLGVEGAYGEARQWLPGNRPCAAVCRATLR